MRRSRLALVLAVAGAAFMAAGPAAASHLPLTFGISRKGPLDVSAVIHVDHRVVDMRGGWNSTAIPCTAFRTLRVRAFVEYTPATGAPIRRQRIRRRAVMNCAEGGPNSGFTLSARSLGMACPNGTWRPGQYSLATNTRHIATGTVAIATLDFRKLGGC
jgi:hypothetical protein